jgi:hypothetical protein
MSDNDQDTYQPYSEAERNAMRAYLQRSEVRMSTMHRIATAFIGGAGLLLLVPIFLRDAIDGILEVVLVYIRSLPTGDLSAVGWTLLVLVLAFLLYNFALSLWIPIYSLFLLLKDIIQFYFSLYAPGFAPSLVHPTFSLGAIALPRDDSARAKRDVIAYQQASNHVDFALPFSEKRRALYFDRLLEATQGDIIPPTRHWENLVVNGWVDENADHKQTDRYHVAMGIARSLDRTLVEEVAVTEMLMVRNVMYLRRLVLRYGKALLMFIWTTIISFIMLPFLKQSALPVLWVLAVGYLVWSMLVMRLMEQPMTWILRHRQERSGDARIDAQLTVLERDTRRWIRLARVLAIATLGCLALMQWVA